MSDREQGQERADTEKGKTRSEEPRRSLESLGSTAAHCGGTGRVSMAQERASSLGDEPQPGWGRLLPPPHHGSRQQQG